MAELSADLVRANLAAVDRRIELAAARAGRDANAVRVLAAVKYLAAGELAALAEAGVTLVGENRAQALIEKVAVSDQRLHWHFIGALQSRKVRLVAPHVELIHSVASRSALAELARHARPGLGILIEVNVAGEAGKAGVAPEELDELMALASVPVHGLMTMPPLSSDPQQSRPYFAELARLARERSLGTLSMGTSQDYEVAVEEGATIVRIGSALYH